MKKIIIAALSLVAIHSVNAQDIYLTRTGKIEFHAGTAVEDVDAVNNEVTSMVNAKTGEIVFNVLIKSFHFKRALMEEHFNENYLESSSIPKATFKGKITDGSTVNFARNGIYKATVAGELNLHGITQQVTMPVTVTISDGKIRGQSSFRIKPEDYKIVVPSLVQDKVAKVVDVIVDCLYEPKK